MQETRHWYVDFVNFPLDREQCRAFENTLMRLRVPKNSLASWVIIAFSRRALPHAVLFLLPECHKSGIENDFLIKNIWAYFCVRCNVCWVVTAVPSNALRTNSCSDISLEEHMSLNPMKSVNLKCTKKLEWWAPRIKTSERVRVNMRPQPHPFKLQHGNDAFTRSAQNESQYMLGRVLSWTVEHVQRSMDICGESDRHSQWAGELSPCCIEGMKTQWVLSAPTDINPENLNQVRVTVMQWVFL
jgi:hypothetical protein